MKTPVCEELLLYQPTSTEDENLRSWYIVNSVFNAFLVISVIILNSVTIQALRKPCSLPRPLKTLLLSLAVSDLGVGLVVVPFYSSSGYSETIQLKLYAPLFSLSRAYFLQLHFSESWL